MLSGVDSRLCNGKSGWQGCTQSKARVFNDGTVRRLETRRWMLDRG